MFEYKRSENYSIPFQCGLYPPPPYYYDDIRSLNIAFRCPLEIKRNFIPPELEPSEELDSFNIIEYPESTIGSYNEIVVVLSCKYEDTPGSYLVNLYVDSDVAFAAGREIWGYPKKMADIKLSQIKENIISGSLTQGIFNSLIKSVKLINSPPFILESPSLNIRFFLKVRNFLFFMFFPLLLSGVLLVDILYLNLLFPTFIKVGY